MFSVYFPFCSFLFLFICRDLDELIASSFMWCARMNVCVWLVCLECKQMMSLPLVCTLTTELGSWCIYWYFFPSPPPSPSILITWNSNKAGCSAKKVERSQQANLNATRKPVIIKKSPQPAMPVTHHATGSTGMGQEQKQKNRDQP